MRLWINLRRVWGTLCAKFAFFDVEEDLNGLKFFPFHPPRLYLFKIKSTQDA